MPHRAFRGLRIAFWVILICVIVIIGMPAIDALFFR